MANQGTAALASDERGNEEPDHSTIPSGRFSGLDIGLLLGRLVLGLVMLGHGAKKTVGWFDGAGVSGFANNLDAQGYRHTTALSLVTGITELVGGALVLLGLFTPLAAAGLCAVMVNVVVLKWGEGWFIPAGYEFELTLAVMAAALAIGGPGRLALDHGRPWAAHYSMRNGLFYIAFGLVCAMIVLVFMRS